MCSTTLTLALSAHGGTCSAAKGVEGALMTTGSQCCSDTWVCSQSGSSVDFWEVVRARASHHSEAMLDSCEISDHTSSEDPIFAANSPDSWHREGDLVSCWSESGDESGGSWLSGWEVGTQNEEPDIVTNEKATSHHLEASWPRGLSPCHGLEEVSAARDHANVITQPASVLFRDYTVEQLIGEGRYGTVWRCYSNVTGERFACKQVEKENVEAVEREVQCLAAAQGHPNVLSLEGVYESDRFVYILTEFCDTGDLLEVISTQTHLSENEAREVFKQLLAAVSHCHRRGVLHRDLKPENVLLSTCQKSGRTIVKIADFGLSTGLQAGQLAQGWVGSKPYDAPEVSALLPYSFPADIFSLGVVLFAMLSGNWPTRTPAGLCLTDDFGFPVWREISAQAKRLLSHMLDQDPCLRPTAEELHYEPWMYTTCAL